jgi:hypothetical protein
MRCDIRELVANGEDFEPPDKVTFLEIPNNIDEVLTDQTGEVIPSDREKSFEGMSSEDVDHIRHLLDLKVSQKDIAKSYKVRPKLIRAIKSHFSS